MMRTVGTCSLCNGAVTVPYSWAWVQPPTPTCSRCGAKPKTPHGEVIQMEPNKLGESGQPIQPLFEG